MINNKKNTIFLFLILLLTSKDIFTAEAVVGRLPAVIDLGNLRPNGTQFQFRSLLPLLPIAGFGILAYLNNLREADIKKLRDLPNKWEENQAIEVLSLDNPRGVRDKFHWAAWEKEQHSAHAIYQQTLPTRQNEPTNQITIINEMLNHIKRSDTEYCKQAFVFKNNEVVFYNSSTSDRTILGEVEINMRSEIKALNADIEKIPFLKQIEKIFINACKKDMMDDHKIKKGLNRHFLYFINDSQFDAAVTALRNTKGNGIKVLNNLFNLHQSEAYQKLCSLVTKKYDTAVDTYLRLIPLFARLNALDILVAKYGGKNSGHRDGFNAQVRIRDDRFGRDDDYFRGGRLPDVRDLDSPRDAARN